MPLLSGFLPKIPFNTCNIKLRHHVTSRNIMAWRHVTSWLDIRCLLVSLERMSHHDITSLTLHHVKPYHILWKLCFLTGLMTLTIALIRDIIKINPYAKSWVCRTNSSAMKALTDEQTDFIPWTADTVGRGDSLRGESKVKTAWTLSRPNLKSEFPSSHLAWPPRFKQAEYW